MNRKILIVVIFIILFGTVWTEKCEADTFVDFDDLPATGESDVPGSSPFWQYSTSYNRDTWTSAIGYASNSNIHNFFNIYLNSYNSDHMGWETYGFLGIDGNNAVNGNSLKYSITGGKNASTLPGSNGLQVTTKQQYLDYVHSGQNPIEGGLKVGHPYLYFMNNSLSSSPLAFPEAQGANRLSMYIYMPEEVNNGIGGYGNTVSPTISIGPYNGIGGHWYHSYCTQGGGWTHVIIDAHPVHNNAWSSADHYPYPSRSLRDLGYDYFNTMYRWYVTFSPYSGIATPPYSVWIDEIEFINDTEPQNNETITSPSVLFKSDEKTFEIGFMDKYKNNAYSYSTYEVRYSFSPISNATWDLATPVHILPDSRFNIVNRTDGKFRKWWPYYQNTWAPFTLATHHDTDLLTEGRKIYFAIKDISQINGNTQNPVTNCGIGGTGSVCGRDYANHGDLFDYAGDQPVLNLIKRVEYQIPKGVSADDAVSPVSPSGLLVL